jgi:MFS family permease
MGPTLGGILTQQLGWRSIFLTTIPIGILIVALVVWKLKGEWAEAEGEAFDWKGSIIYGVGLIALMLGLSQLPDISGAVLMVFGVAGLVVFGFLEMKIKSPVLDLRIFAGNRAFTFSNLAALINYSATFGIGFLLSLYLQYIKALDPQQAGLVLVAQPAMQALFSPLAGRLSDRIEPRYVASIGMGLSVIGLLALTQLNGDSSMVNIVITLLVLGLGFALFSSPNTNAVMSSVSKRFYGVASGTLGTMRLVGQVWSMGIVTMVFSIIVGQSQITPDQYPLFLKSMHVDFIILCLLCILGVFASLARGQVRKPGMNTE